MQDSFYPPGYGWFRFLRNAPARVGIYTGVCLSLVFTVWIFVANRMPLLEPFALQRNIVASLLLLLIAAMPVVRFRKSPSELISAGIVAWSLLSLTFAVLSIKFVRLEDDFSAFHVFVLGAIVYLIFATLAWIGMIVRRARTAQTPQSPR